MAAIACIERGVFSSDDQDAALYKYARFRIDRIVRSRDSDGCPTYVSTNEKAEDGNPRVKRLLYCEQEEFGFAISQKWAQIDAEVRVIHKMEARYEVMFGVAYHREMLPQDE